MARKKAPEAPTTETFHPSAQSLSALADSSRLHILHLLAVSSGEMTVTEVVSGLASISQPTVSHHLAILARAGFIVRDKRGVNVYYRLAPDAPTAQLNAVLSAIVGA